MEDNMSESRAGPSGHVVPILEVSVRSDDPLVRVIEVQGELDIATGPTLRERVASYSDPSSSGGHPSLMVYLLSELEFMDCRGFHYLLTAVDGYGPETIAIREPSRAVQRLLELVGMNSMIEADC